MAKDLESLRISRQAATASAQRYGFVPQSIIGADWSITTRRDEQMRPQTLKTESEWHSTAFELSPTSLAHQSDFPHNLCRFFIRYLCPETLGDAGPFENHLPVILDPFSGHNSRMEDVWALGRNYVGWDVSRQFHDANTRIKLDITSNRMPGIGDPEIMLVNGDSRLMDYEDLADFAITSPPFWDVEKYGTEPEQIGTGHTYEEFLEGLTTILANVYRGLKDGSFFVLEASDIKRWRRLIPFHAHAMTALQEVGFILHDIVICDFGRGFRQNFPAQLEAQKTTSKNHSYFIVARKGEPAWISDADAARYLISQYVPDEVVQGAML